MDKKLNKHFIEYIINKNINIDLANFSYDKISTEVLIGYINYIKNNIASFSLEEQQKYKEIFKKARDHIDRILLIGKPIQKEDLL